MCIRDSLEGGLGLVAGNKGGAALIQQQLGRIYTGHRIRGLGIELHIRLIPCQLSLVGRVSLESSLRFQLRELCLFHFCIGRLRRGGVGHLRLQFCIARFQSRLFALERRDRLCGCLLYTSRCV